MHDHWALTAGKMNTSDLVEPPQEILGKKLSLQTAKRSAVREFKEELNISADGSSFESVVEFCMPEKQLYFTMLAWPIKEHQVVDFAPDGAEVDKLGRFSLNEFTVNPNLGDAIVYRKDKIISFLNEKFKS
jgi:8-oxo-dGTP pyrophosphatase MutT (NUDIX family)